MNRRGAIGVGAADGVSGAGKTMLPEKFQRESPHTLKAKNDTLKGKS